ncbi:sulfatase-like hydrolase/transferase [Pseudomonas citronellolis]|uniref:sulfatase-like hydrolase/transferase n=1 Tax=Pseudomonas citronellolis TaxID=53408 RepID=UPI00078D7569|nr:sulfatase-like hydrolase/transferase [Pseudomonas citronellolis]AMO74558.1 Sulfatase [Pseudomonas citronellolis]
MKGTTRFCVGNGAWLYLKGAGVLFFLNSLMLAVNGYFRVVGGRDKKVISSIDLEQLLSSSFLNDVLWFFFSIFSLCVFWALVVALGAFFFRVGLGWERGRARECYWLLLLLSFLALLLLNSVEFPDGAWSSAFSSYSLFYVLVGCSGLVIVWGVGRIVVRRPALSLFGFLLLVLGFSAHMNEVNGGAEQVVRKERPNMPNILIIGFDSLRPSALSSGLMPSLSYELSRSVRFSNAVTPMARTFPSWMSVLSGRDPQATGARFNLTSYSMIKRDVPLLTDFLKEERGYETFYAMDERRFANFDEQYGFDNIVGPRVGVGDFVLGGISDVPLINFFRSFRIGGWFFPFVRSNRAVDISYSTGEFLSDIYYGLSSSLQVGNTGKMMVFHFCGAHWPYSRDVVEDARGDEMYGRYLGALSDVDGQFYSLMKDLQSGGYLENALVFFISDHGESFDRDFRRFSSLRDGGEDVLLGGWGHGTVVTVPEQFKVLLAYQEYRGGKLVNKAAVHDKMVSLLDIFPTVKEFLGVDGEVKLDGQSLFGLHGERYFFLETGFSVPAILQKDPDEGAAFAQGADYYQVEKNGYVSLRYDRYNELLLKKDLASIKGDEMVYFSVDKDGRGFFRYLNFKTLQWSVLDYENSPGQHLLSELCEHFSSDPRLRNNALCGFR